MLCMFTAVCIDPFPQVYSYLELLRGHFKVDVLIGNSILKKKFFFICPFSDEN